MITKTKNYRKIMSFAGLKGGFLLSKKEQQAKEFERQLERDRKEEEVLAHQHQNHIETQDPTRCYSCHRKIGLTAIRCRCQFYFCGRHRYAEKHGCTYDYSNKAKQDLEKKLPRVVCPKVETV